MLFFPELRLRSAKKQLPNSKNVSAQLRSNIDQFMKFHSDALDEIQKELNRLEDQRFALLAQEDVLRTKLDTVKNKIRERTKIEANLPKIHDLTERTKEIEKHLALEKEIQNLNLEINHLTNVVDNKTHVEFKIKKLANARFTLENKNKATITAAQDISTRLGELEQQKTSTAVLTEPSVYKKNYQNIVKGSLWGFFTSFLPTKSSAAEARKNFVEYVDDKTKYKKGLLSLTRKYHDALPQLNKIVESYSILLGKKPRGSNTPAAPTNPSRESPQMQRR